MQVGEHFRITGGALKNWAIAQAQDSLAVAALWLVGLLILHVPWAPFSAVLAAILGGSCNPSSTPVFGCPLFDLEPTAAKEARK